MTWKLRKGLIEFMTLVADLQNKYPEWRTGQTYFNALAQMDHECADMIRGTQYDPFYDDNKLDAFMLEVWSFKKVKY